jgi:hypothetical protein
MCGIVGIAGDMFSREELTMKRLLLLDSLRGMDSTGMAAVKIGGKKVEIAKRASHCFNLFDTKSFNEILSAPSALAFIGHNRSATSGLIKDVNAHPFQFEHITGVQNGTLEDKDFRMLEDWLGEKYNVDSEALFAAIAKFGVKEVIPKLSKGIDHYKGAWSLVWWDSNDKTLNFLRNEHRPLWYCYSEDFKQIFWASEFWMLDIALQKTGAYTLYKKQSAKDPTKTFRFFQTDPDIHYSVNVEALSKGGKERPKIKAEPLAGKEPVAAATVAPFGDPSKRSGSGSGSSTRTGTHTQSSKTNTKTTLWTKSSSDKEPAAITLMGDTSDPYAGYYNKMNFSFLGTHSSYSGADPKCAWCHNPVPFGQPGITVFTRCNLIHCARCSGHDVVDMTSDIAPANRIFLPRSAFKALL